MPTMALSLSMILHELCTNAVKYGALVRAAGTVHITWDKSPSPEGPHLTLCWRELGGPPVTPPQRTGFGTRLIERSVTRELGGTVRMAHEAAGLVCTIEVPLPLIAGEPV
jgi:two-component sensor histidine kinase